MVLELIKKYSSGICIFLYILSYFSWSEFSEGNGLESQTGLLKDLTNAHSWLRMVSKSYKKNTNK